MTLIRRGSTRGDASNAGASPSLPDETPHQFSAAEIGEPFEHEGQGLRAEKIGDLLRYVIVDVIIL